MSETTAARTPESTPDGVGPTALEPAAPDPTDGLAAGDTTATTWPRTLTRDHKIALGIGLALVLLIAGAAIANKLLAEPGPSTAAVSEVASSACSDDPDSDLCELEQDVYACGGSATACGRQHIYVHFIQSNPEDYGTYAEFSGTTLIQLGTDMCGSMATIGSSALADTYSGVFGQTGAETYVTMTMATICPQLVGSVADDL